jgi:hypothetical protein
VRDCNKSESIDQSWGLRKSTSPPENLAWSK